MWLAKQSVPAEARVRWCGPWVRERGNSKNCDFLCSIGITEAVQNRKLGVIFWLQKPQGLSVVGRFSSAIPEPHKRSPSVLKSGGWSIHNGTSPGCVAIPREEKSRVIQFTMRCAAFSVSLTYWVYAYLSKISWNGVSRVFFFLYFLYWVGHPQIN